MRTRTPLAALFAIGLGWSVTTADAAEFEIIGDFFLDGLSADGTAACGNAIDATFETVRWTEAEGVVRLGLSSGAGGMAALAVATTWPVLALALLLIVVGQGMVTPTLSGLVANRAPARRRGGALGMQQAAGGLGRVVGPALGGVLFEHVGLAAPYVVGAVLTRAALGLVAGERDQPDGGVAHTGGAGRQAAR